MEFNQLLIFILVVAYIVEASEVAREVDGGVELLRTGSIELITPEILSFTVKNYLQCKGVCRICFVSEPTVSRDVLREKYLNVGRKCPSDSCTMILEPQHLGTWGLLREVRDNNFYATYIDGEPTSCPRQVIDGRWKFTIVDMTDCPVIVDGAKLAKDDTDKSKSSKISKTWVITICLGVVLLLFVVVIVGLYICMRFK